MPLKTRNDLSAEHVRRIFDYDPETGILRWRYNPERPKEWNTRRAGKPAGAPCGANGAIQVRIDDVLYLAHRIIWLWMTGEWPKEELDHRYRDPTDNRWEKLREATRGQNMRNRGMQSNNRSGFLGVRFRPHHGKWEARITVDRKTVWRHYADSAQEAAAARREALPKYHGEFATDHD